MLSLQVAIKEKALSLGFDTVGFTVPALHEQASRGLEEYLALGHHGDMAWMENNADRRAAPKTLWPEAKSVIVLGHNYAPERNPMEKLSHKTIGNISCYALNEDYHDVIKKKLKTLARWVAEDFWFFLGSIFLNIPLPLREGLGEGKFSKSTPHPSPPPQGGREIGSCGTCTKCLDICPTQAFTAERQLDARKCIAYLTIEHKGQIPLEFRKAIGNRIYGCDDCLAVCPWNKFAQESKEMAYHPRTSLEAPLLRDLVQLDDAAFRAFFAKSPVKRIGRDRFVSNVLVAIGNSGDVSLLDSIEPLRQDASPLVAEIADWANQELKKC